MNKWVGVGLGALLGVTNLGMIVLVVNSRTTKLPKINLPVPFAAPTASIHA